MKKKRFIALMVASVMTITSLTACGEVASTADNSDSSTTEESSDVGESVTQEAADEETTVSGDIPTITWYAAGTTTDSQDRISEAATKMLNEAGINVNFKIIWTGWDSYSQNITNMLASGESFDIFNDDISSIDNFALSGGVVEITDENLEKYLPDVVNGMGEDIVNNCRYNGKLYATPVAHEYAQYKSVIYNSGIADKYGIDMTDVASVDDLDSKFEELHSKAPDIYMVSPYNNDKVLMVMGDFDDVNGSSSLCIGFNLTDDSDGPVCKFEDENVISALKKIHDWSEKGYVLTDTTADYTSMFRTEGSVFSEINRAKPGNAEQYANNGQTFKQINFNEDSPNRTENDFPGGWGNAISTTSENPTLAMQVLNFAYSNKDFINLLTFGEEGTDYSLSDDGYVVMNDTGYAADCYGSASWQMGNHYLNTVTQTQADAGLSDIWEKTKEFNDSGKILNHTGFYFDSSSLTTEVAAIQNTYNEYASGLLTGTVDVDSTLKSFVSDLYANGMDKVLAECQKQYNTFLESK